MLCCILVSWVRWADRWRFPWETCHKPDSQTDLSRAFPAEILLSKLTTAFFHFLFPAKNIFRVRFRDPAPGQSHTLQANDIFHKQQWFNCIRSAIAPYQPAVAPSELKDLPELSEEVEENNPAVSCAKIQRRQFTMSSSGHMELDENTCECSSVVDMTEESKNVKTYRMHSGLRRTREKARLSGKRKETLV